MFLYLDLPRILSSVFACRHGSVGAQLARIDEETYKRCESINRRRSNTRSQTVQAGAFRFGPTEPRELC
jgi:hypothetical protein